MAAQDKVTFKQDLTEPVKIRHYEGVVFTGDDCGNLIKVALFDGGVPYSGGGTVSATAILADGTTYPLTQGSITDNMVSVPLEAGALAVSGLMGLYVKISGDGIICTVLNAIFTVQATDTGMVPAAMVTTVNELVAAIRDAQDSIPADLTNLLAAVAPTFSTSTAYSAGTYVWQGGVLYRFTAAHPAGTWTRTDAVAVALGNDVADLKSAFGLSVSRELPLQLGLKQVLNNETINVYNAEKAEDGKGFHARNGRIQSNANMSLSDYIPVLPGDVVTQNTTLNSVTWGNILYNEEREIESYYFSSPDNQTVTIPDGVYWIRYTTTIAAKDTFSVVIVRASNDAVKAYVDGYGLERVNLSVSEKNTILYTTEETPNGNSVTTAGTFWLTNCNENIRNAINKKIESITLVAQNNGTLTVRGYDFEIDGSLSADILKNIAIEANSKAYDIAILNLTAGKSTYLFDGTDERVTIVDNSLICPQTLGLFKDGDTGVFKYKTASGVNDVSYFVHASYASGQKTAAKLYVGVGVKSEALNVGIEQDNGNQANSSVLLEQITDVKSNGLVGKRISFLADSITTFQGYNPSGYAYWYPQGDITNVEQTWWKQLLNETGMILGVNAAWSGSTVTGNSESTTSAAAGCSTARVTALGANGIPDIIIVFIGINDFGLNNRRAVGDWIGESAIPSEGTKTIFSEAYALMMKKVMTAYPSAIVYCCTLMETTKTNYDQDGASQDFPTTNTNGTVLKQYNDRIRTIAKAVGARVIEIHECGIHHWNTDLFTTDGIHPNSNGAVLVKNVVKNKLLSDFH